MARVHEGTRDIWGNEGMSGRSNEGISGVRGYEEFPGSRRDVRGTRARGDIRGEGMSGVQGYEGMSGLREDVKSIITRDKLTTQLYPEQKQINTLVPPEKPTNVRCLFSGLAFTFTLTSS